ncbi:hypothetical protein SERLA73DRAFT_149353 [Serpula lacrymans var. lacrymans S7.3]|uniref:Uncharacterized protein n=1 Tax=Serpula lacrymans var. lacrymans (strain S7.3) TaxID=936435 RepID=F8PI02_SERL3|nr:hypothetical protein SERLA73DRAFT_149353 [Serpula lacrymans var. lacrymans S7.3]
MWAWLFSGNIQSHLVHFSSREDGLHDIPLLKQLAYILLKLNTLTYIEPVLKKGKKNDSKKRKRKSDKNGSAEKKGRGQVSTKEIAFPDKIHSDDLDSSSNLSEDEVEEIPMATSAKKQGEKVHPHQDKLGTPHDHIRNVLSLKCLDNDAYEIAVMDLFINARSCQVCRRKIVNEYFEHSEIQPNTPEPVSKQSKRKFKLKDSDVSMPDSDLTASLKKWCKQQMVEEGLEGDNIFGAQCIMPDDLLARVVVLACFQKLISVTALQEQTNWCYAELYGPAIIAIAHSHYLPPRATPPSRSHTSPETSLISTINTSSCALLIDSRSGLSLIDTINSINVVVPALASTSTSTTSVLGPVKMPNVLPMGNDVIMAN